MRVIVAGAAMLAPLAAQAQAYRCSVPQAIDTPRPDTPDARDPVRRVATGGYTLALTWSPQYCRTAGDTRSARFQCGGGNRFGFTLHGLWPDGVGKTWPQYCRPAAIVPQAVIRRNLCTTPSPQLLQHEYAKHGTCMNLTPARYFAQSGRLFAQVRYPDMDALSRRANLTAGQFAVAFARANRGLNPRSLRLTATRDGWLDEVWICLDTNFKYRRCPTHQASLAPATRLKLWRGGR